VRALTAGRGIGQLARPAPVRPPLVELGRALAAVRDMAHVVPARVPSGLPVDH